MRNNKKYPILTKKKLVMYLLFSCFVLLGVQTAVYGESEKVPSNTRSTYIPSPPKESKIILDSSDNFYPPNGYQSGIREGGRMWVITDKVNQYGTMWARNRLNLDKDFTMIAHIYLGNDGTGANDGITFTMHGDKRNQTAISVPDTKNIVPSDHRGNFLGVYGGFGIKSNKTGPAHVGYQKSFLIGAVSVEFDTFLNSGKGGYYAKGFEHQDEAVSKLPNSGRMGVHNGHISQVFPGFFNADYLDYINKDPSNSYPTQQETDFGLKHISRVHWNPVVAKSPMSNGRWKRIQVDWKASTRTLSANSNDGIENITQSVSYSKQEVTQFWYPSIKDDGVMWGFTGGSSDIPTVNIVAVEQMPQQSAPEVPEVPNDPKNGVAHTAKIANISKGIGDSNTVSGAKGETIRLTSTMKLKSGFTSQKIQTVMATLDRNLQYKAGSAKLNNVKIADSLISVSGNTVKYLGNNLALTSSKTENKFSIEATIKNTAIEPSTLYSNFTASGGDLTQNLPTAAVSVTISAKKPPVTNSDIRAVISLRNNLTEISNKTDINSPKNSKPFVKMKAIRLMGTTSLSNATFKLKFLRFAKYVNGTARYDNGALVPSSNVTYDSVNSELSIRNLSNDAGVEVQVEFTQDAPLGVGLPFSFSIRDSKIANDIESLTAQIFLEAPVETEKSPELMHKESVSNGNQTGLNIKAFPKDTVVFKDEISATTETTWKNGTLEILTDNRLDYDLKSLKINGMFVSSNNITIESGKLIIKELPNVTKTNTLNVEISAVVKETAKNGDTYKTSFVAKDGNLADSSFSRELTVEVIEKEIGTIRIIHLNNATGETITNVSDIYLNGEVGTSVVINPQKINGYTFVFLVPNLQQNSMMEFDKNEKTIYMYYRKEELAFKFINVPTIDFGKISILTNSTKNNYPTENIKISVRDDSKGQWNLYLRISEPFKTEKGLLLKGNFYFKNGTGAATPISNSGDPVQVYTHTPGNDPSPQTEINWNKDIGQGMSYVNEPGNIKAEYRGLFQWNLVNGF